ncbi:MAG: hypothetical protein Q9213_004440 [Squamulea squamosa]
MSSSITFLQTLSISTSLVAAGGIASITLFNVPPLQALPASRALPQIRWLFSRGSHIFPTAAAISSAGFVSLAFFALSEGQRSLPQFLEGCVNNGLVQGYLAAAALSISIGPVTSIMVPTNFELMGMNEEKGGTRSEKNAAVESKGKGQASEFSDLSKPQGKVKNETTKEDDEKVEKLLAKFGTLNMARGILIGAGGIDPQAWEKRNSNDGFSGFDTFDFRRFGTSIEVKSAGLRLAQLEMVDAVLKHSALRADLLDSKTVQPPKFGMSVGFGVADGTG